MIKAELVGGDALAAHLAAMPTNIRNALRLAVQNLTIKVLTRVKEQKLSGQVLNVRTGRLRRSINQRVEVDGEKVTGFVGTMVEYAPIHEYGFSGSENIREHMRTSKAGKQYTVRAHTRNVNMPERSFLRSSVADMKDEIETTIKTALQDAMK